MACAVSGTTLEMRGALTPLANCNSAKARRTTRTCCTPPFTSFRNACLSLFVTLILRAGRAIPQVCVKTILLKNGLLESFQAVRDLALVVGAVYGDRLSANSSRGHVVFLLPALAASLLLVHYLVSPHAGWTTSLAAIGYGSAIGLFSANLHA